MNIWKSSGTFYSVKIKSTAHAEIIVCPHLASMIHQQKGASMYRFFLFPDLDLSAREGTNEGEKILYPIAKAASIVGFGADLLKRRVSR